VWSAPMYVQAMMSREMNQHVAYKAGNIKK
jgi:hypothetical protein